MQATDPILTGEDLHFSSRFYEWSHAMSYGLLVIFLSRIVGFLLPGVFNFLYSNLSGKVRQRNHKLQQLKSELKLHKEELGSLHMVDQFAKYSKVQRKIKSIEKELSILSRDKNITTITSKFAFKVVNFLLSSVTFAVLVAHTPSKSAFAEEGFYSWLQFDCGVHYAIVNFLYILSYVPAKLWTILWLTLCRLSVGKFMQIVELKCGTAPKQNFSLFNAFPGMNLDQPLNGTLNVNPSMATMRMNEETLD